MQAIDLSSLTSRREAESLLAEYESDDMVRQFLLTNLIRSAEGVFSWRVNLPVLMASYEALRAKPVASEVFEGPVLFVKGADSNYIKEEYREQILALFPNARVKVIMQTGHWLHAEKPQTFYTIVKDFLAQN